MTNSLPLATVIARNGQLGEARVPAGTVFKCLAVVDWRSTAKQLATALHLARIVEFYTV